MIKLFIEICKRWGLVGVIVAYFLVQDFNSRALDREVSRNSLITLEKINNEVHNNKLEIAGIKRDVDNNNNRIEKNESSIDRLFDLKIADLIK